MEVLPLGAIRAIGWCWNGRSCMQNAPECQDPVTTRQDLGWTCRDVSANMKPSLYVLQSVRDAEREAVNAPAETQEGVSYGRSCRGRDLSQDAVADVNLVVAVSASPRRERRDPVP